MIIYMKRFILIYLIAFVHTHLLGQVSGVVIGQNGKGIEYARVALLNITDSLFVTVATTDSTGQFIFPSFKDPVLLKISCMGYKERIITTQQEGAHIYLLEQNERLLSEVVVTGERPLVNISEEGIRFHAPSIIKNKPVNNAFDILGEIPALEKVGDKISILGASSTTIILNGRKKALSTAQLVQYLKSLPASKVKHVEILYSTPPQYGVKGAAINILFDDEKKIEQRGEFYMTARQAYYLSSSGGGTVLLSNNKNIIDFGYAHSYNKSLTEEKLDAVHSLNTEKTYTILQKNNSKGNNRKHDFRFGFDHDFNKESSVKISMNSSIQKSELKRTGVTLFDKVALVNSLNAKTDSKSLHNMSFDFKYKALLSGGDYVYYKNKSSQDFQNESSSMQAINSESHQIVHTLNAYINHKHKIKSIGTLSYGTDFAFIWTKNKNNTYIDNSQSNSFDQKLHEYIWDAFLGWSKPITKKASINISLTYQYLKSSVAHNRILWETNNLYPNISFIWRVKQAKVLQFFLTSEKKYPSYWQMTPSVSYLSVYTQVEGNPSIRPSDVYSSRIVYIRNNKYIFQLFGNISKKHIQQVLYQCPDTIKAIYKIVNLDRHNTFGGLAVIPFKMASNLNAKIVLSGFYLRDKGRIEDIHFVRDKYIGRIAINNTFTIHKLLSIDASAYYVTKAIQGIYDIDPIYDLSLGILWKPSRQVSIGIKGEDLLKGKQMHTRTWVEKQNYKQILGHDLRMVSLSFRYNIGGFESKKTKTVDTSRLGI